MSAIFDNVSSLFLYGFYLPGPHVAKNASIRIGTAGNAGDVLKLALFDADGWRVLDWGSIDISTTATVNTALATPREISPGSYWVGTMCNVTNSPAVLMAHPRTPNRAGGRINNLPSTAMPTRFDPLTRAFEALQRERPYVAFSEI